MKPPKAYWLNEAKNWGDVFTPFLFKHAFGLDVDWAPRHHAEVFCCGSLLERVNDGFDGYVLGSGMGYEDTRRNLRKVKSPLLLRGRLSADRCEFQVPVRFGDPGIIANAFVSPGMQKCRRYGVVPHYVDKDLPDVVRWVSRGACLIDIESGIQEVIDAIACCEQIVSSSLHGLVIADSLGVPSKFVKLSDKVLGDSFKFHDYYSAYGETLVPSRTIEAGFKDCRTRDVSAAQTDVRDALNEYVGGLQ